MNKIIDVLGYDPVNQAAPDSIHPNQYYWLMWAEDGWRSKNSGRYFETYEDAWADADATFRKSLSWFNPAKYFPL